MQRLGHVGKPQVLGCHLTLYTLPQDMFAGWAAQEVEDRKANRLPAVCVCSHVSQTAFRARALPQGCSKTIYAY